MRIGAIEAGGTKMVLAVMNEEAEVLDRNIIPTTEPDSTVKNIAKYYSDKNIKMLGVGTFGPVDINRKSDTYGHILKTPKPFWSGYDLAGNLERVTNVPVYIDTDVNAAAIGEHEWGAGVGVDSLVYITVGTGIGAGVIVDGRVIHGAVHPECGHVIVPREKNDDFEGCCPFHKNCLEGMASGFAIEKRWGKKGQELLDKKEVWELESFYLAEGIVDYMMVFSPQMIIVGGGVSKKENLLSMVRKKVVALSGDYLPIKEISNIENYIVSPGLNDLQAIKGCVKLCMMG